MWAKHKNNQGFTIVELLIVIVVIAILAAVTIVSYNGLQKGAYDSVVKNDLDNIGKQITLFDISNGRFPKGSTDLSTMNIKASKTSYGIGMLSGGNYYNLVYCWPNTTNPFLFAVVAESKSGAVFEYSDGGVRNASYGFSGGSMVICANAGVTLTDGNARDWFYSSNNWQSYVGG